MTTFTNHSEDTKVSRYKEAREELKALSKGAKVLVKMGAFDCVNDAIIMTVYTTEEHQEFKKFHEWKKEGKTIIKGSKGFPVWSKPIERPEDPQQPEQEGEEKETYWGICYLFSNAQVRDGKAV